MTAWFSKKQASENTSQQVPQVALVVRTMQDDLNDIKSGKKESFQSQVEASQQAKSTETVVLTKAPLGSNPFSEEGNILLSSQGTIISTAQPNTENRVTVSDQPTKGAPTLVSSMAADTKQSKTTNDQPTTKRRLLTIMSSFIAIVLLGSAVFVGWRFFFNTEVMPEETVISNPPLEDRATEPLPVSEVVISTPLFSLDKPNYLPLNVETTSVSDIRATFSQTAERMREANITSPIEFFITDHNNNPLAFNRFAFLIQLELNPDLLALADENFSIYIYNDGDRSHLGLVVSFKDFQTATALITTTETRLPYALRALFLDQTADVSQKLIFQSTAYKQFTVRFANVANSADASIDYILHDNQWIVGMSKNTLRAIIDTKIP